MNATHAKTHVVLGDDILCRGCEYNLRGLATDAACPECLAPVWVSAAGDQLRYASPRWLATILRASQVIFISLLAAWAVAIIGVLLIDKLGWGGRGRALLFIYFGAT